MTFALPGRHVVGIDPSATMLDHARHRPQADRVQWILDDSRVLDDGCFDIIVMTGNVAQHIPDGAWGRTLRDLRRVAGAGTVVAFESRNPLSRAWTDWEQPEPTIRETAHGPLRESCEVIELERGQVLLRFINEFMSSGETVVQQELLTFRDRKLISEGLAEAGFEVSSVWGDWHQSPFDGTQPIMVFEARAV